MIEQPDYIYDVQKRKMVPNPDKPKPTREQLREDRRRRRAQRRAQMRRRRGSCLTRLITTFILLILIVAAPLLIGYVYHLVASQNENYPPPGELVNVRIPTGDLGIVEFDMHLNCTGSGRPIVVLDADIGAWSVHWSSLQEQVSGFTRVCSFDRPGYGWSERNPLSRTAEQLALELFSLLEAASEDGPYVMVAHGFAGITARVFARNFRDQVAGMVLIDTYTEALIPTLPNTYQQGITVRKVSEFLAPLGTVRLVDQFWRYDRWLLGNLSLPAGAQDLFRAGYYKPTYWEATWAEYEALPFSAQQAADLGGLGDIPLVVISTLNRPVDAWPDRVAYEEAQTMLRFLTQDGELVTDDNGKHYIHLINPTLVVTAIQNVVTRAR